jgi:hypothetical protein
MAIVCVILYGFLCVISGDDASKYSSDDLSQKYNSVSTSNNAVLKHFLDLLQ